MGMLADLKEKVEAIEAAHRGGGKNQQQGLLVMPIDNRDIKVEAAAGGLMSPREGYGVGSLATKGIMKALKQRTKSKTDPKIDRVEDPIDPSLLKKIEDFKPDTTTSKINEDKPEYLVNEMKIVEGMKPQDVYDTIEEEVFDSLWMDDTVPYEERWGFMRELLLDTKTKTQPLYTEEVEEAVRSGLRRFLYEVDADYSDAVSNRQVDDIEEIEDNLFKDLITEITKGDRGKKQEGGSLMSPREGYRDGGVDTSQNYLASPMDKPRRETPQELGITQPPFYTSQLGKDGKYKMDEAIRIEQFSNWRNITRQGFDIQENNGNWLAKRIRKDSVDIFPVDENTWTLKKREPVYREDGSFLDSAPIIESDGGYIQKQEGGGLMSPREGYGFGSVATKLAKTVAKKLGKSADEAWDSSAKKQEFVQKAVNSLTDEDKTRIESKEYGLISHYGDKLDVEQFSRPGIERHKETILWNSGGDMKQYEKYLDTYIEMMQEGERFGKQEGGEMAMPPELMEQDVPVDTYPNMTPEEEAMPIASDEQMQEDYVDYVTAEVLTTSEQDYLNAALDNDPQLEGILDKVVTYATEFTGEGKVEGPGTGISDSIPARLSDGEFVITEKATDQIGADNLQTMMDEAERAADGGMMQKYALGGAVDNPMLGGAVKDTTPLMDEKTGMYGTTRQDDEMKKQMMYANRMPSIIGR